LSLRPIPSKESLATLAGIGTLPAIVVFLQLVSVAKNPNEAISAIALIPAALFSSDVLFVGADYALFDFTTKGVFVGLKILIVLLFIGVLISLSSGLVFLLKDIQSPSKRTLYALGIRICLAGLLMMAIFYGLYTGKLGSGAPWDKKLSRDQIEQQLKQ
jgi:hypothetical protein